MDEEHLLLADYALSQCCIYSQQVSAYRCRIQDNDE